MKKKVISGLLTAVCIGGLCMGAGIPSKAYTVAYEAGPAWFSWENLNQQKEEISEDSAAEAASSDTSTAAEEVSEDSVSEAVSSSTSTTAEKAEDSRMASAVEGSAEASEGGSFTYTTEEEKEKYQEYEKAGITEDKEGNLTYDGSRVKALLDEDGGFYTNGSVEEGVYLYLSRDEDGSIRSVEKLSGQEVLAGYAAWNEEES